MAALHQRDHETEHPQVSPNLRHHRDQRIDPDLGERELSEKQQLGRERGQEQEKKDGHHGQKSDAQDIPAAPGGIFVAHRRHGHSGAGLRTRSGRSVVYGILWRRQRVVWSPPCRGSFRIYTKTERNAGAGYRKPVPHDLTSRSWPEQLFR